MAESQKPQNAAVPKTPVELLLDHLIQPVQQALKAAFGVEVEEKVLAAQLEGPRADQNHDVSLRTFMFMKASGQKKPADVATVLVQELQKILAEDPLIAKVEAVGAYVNFSAHQHKTTAAIIDMILEGNFLEPVVPNKERIMIEYSQPNTHKAFHVGHMRNAALGDSLVRTFEALGHPVVAVNYFGDEGAHIAKCLWLLRKRLASGEVKLAEVPEAERAEFLGGLYQEAVELLSLDTMTKFPYPGVEVAKVVSIEAHPDPAAPQNWHKVGLAWGNPEAPNQSTVICGGAGYQVGDSVAYYPVGAKLKGVEIAPKDMQGVMSEGVMLALRELERTEAFPEAPVRGADVPKVERPAAAMALAEAAAAEEEKQAEEAGGKKKKGGKKGGKKAAAGGAGAGAAGNNMIAVLPANLEAPSTKSLAQQGSLLPAGVDVLANFQAVNEECRAVLRGMEDGDKEVCDLWEETKHWSLVEFRRIYKWLGCRFDHDFFESEVSESSKNLVKDYADQGKVFGVSNGALGVDLSEFNLGYCVVLKSDGAGLYATKDLALATKKFDEFGIDRSIYVVDAAQAHHFRQVFKVLELMGYEKAKNCFHLSYGTVVLPEGKMSSRKGTVILFSKLRQILADQILQEFLSKYVGQWPDEEIQAAVHAISAATIKYGMLGIESSKDIVFDIKEWTAKSGDNGAYLLYAYARARSILREVPEPQDVEADVSLLLEQCSPDTKRLLQELAGFWKAASAASENYNPSHLTHYGFGLSQQFMKWYEKNRIKDAEDPLKKVELRLVRSFAEVIKRVCGLLGIWTLERM